MSGLSSNASSPPILSASAFPSLENLAQTSASTAGYKRVEPHWFYCKKYQKPLNHLITNSSSINYDHIKEAQVALAPVDTTNASTNKLSQKNVWEPFSVSDSSRIEYKYKYCSKILNSQVDGTTENIACKNSYNPSFEFTIIHTDGGRYDVDLTTMERRPVYWTEDSGEIFEVRRCTWFYIDPIDGRYVPYEPQIASLLENEYRKGIISDSWNRRVEDPNSKDFFIMYDDMHFVNIKSSLKRDEWAAVFDGKICTLIVKRGIQDYDKIQDDETPRIDHVIFVIHGIGEYCDFKFRTINQCVDGMREMSSSLLKSHFKSYVERGLIGRVEFIPCNWHKILHSESTGVDKRLRSITLPSIKKLRDYTNDTIVDVLFYTSPIYCQTITDTVGNELNKLYELFLERNPGFDGTVSVIGHSLGSLIAFDILSHQTKEDAIQKELENLSKGIVNNMDISSKGSIAEPDFIDSFQPSEPTLLNDLGKDDITKLDQPVLTDGLTYDVNSAKGRLPSQNTSTQSDEINETNRTLVASMATKCLSSLRDLYNVEEEWINLLRNEKIDWDSLVFCTDADLKDIGIPLGPRKKIMKCIAAIQFSNDERKSFHSMSSPLHYRFSAPGSSQNLQQKHSDANSLTNPLVTLDSVIAANTKGGLPSISHTPSPFAYNVFGDEQGAKTSETSLVIPAGEGTGQPRIAYTRLKFRPDCFFALGSPIGLFLTIRGIELIGDTYSLPTCPHFYNIFHPYDPVAFRIEPLVMQHPVFKPVLVPHHKGRKRMHLELKENINKMSYELKQTLYQTFRNTMDSLHHISFMAVPNNSISPKDRNEKGLKTSRSAYQISSMPSSNEKGKPPTNNDIDVNTVKSQNSRKSSFLDRFTRSPSLASIIGSTHTNFSPGHNNVNNATENSMVQYSAHKGTVEVVKPTNHPYTYKDENCYDMDANLDSFHKAKINLPDEICGLNALGSPAPLKTDANLASLNSRLLKRETTDFTKKSPPTISIKRRSKSTSQLLNGKNDFRIVSLSRLNSISSHQGDNSDLLESKNVINPSVRAKETIRLLENKVSKPTRAVGSSLFRPLNATSDGSTYTQTTKNSPANLSYYGLPTPEDLGDSRFEGDYCDFPMGRLNQGHRIDYALQEKPIELFNEYIFALHSHVGYWDSEDTILMILNELYSIRAGIKGSLHQTIFQEIKNSIIPSLFSKRAA